MHPRAEVFEDTALTIGQDLPDSRWRPPGGELELETPTQETDTDKGEKGEGRMRAAVPWKIGGTIKGLARSTPAKRGRNRRSQEALALSANRGSAILPAMNDCDHALFRMGRTGTRPSL